MKKNKPILILQNNTAAVQPVSLFTTNPNQSGGINAAPTYSWNVSITGFTGLTDLVLQVRISGGSFTNLAAKISTSNLSGLLAALNSLNVGYFYFVMSGTDILITTSNNIFVFGNLTINQATSTFAWNIAGGLQVNNPAVVTAASMQFTDTRSGQILSANGLGPLVPPVFIPQAFNMNYPASKLTPGDTVQLQIIANPGSPSISVLLTRDGTTVINSTQTSNLLLLNFTYYFDAFYAITASIN